MTVHTVEYVLCIAGEEISVKLTFKHIRSLRASWKGSLLAVSAPVGTSRGRIDAWLESIAGRLLNKKPRVSFALDTTLHFNELEIEIGRQSLKPRSIIVENGGVAHRVLIGDDISPDSPRGKIMISNAIKHVAYARAADILIPRAQSLARSLGVVPRQWKIMRGNRTLGKCTSVRDISLSYMCVFLPTELRDYIICHELAHLTYMNHSSAFHSLVDKYLCGREKELTRKLKVFDWPVERI